MESAAAAAHCKRWSCTQDCLSCRGRSAAAPPLARIALLRILLVLLLVSTFGKLTRLTGRRRREEMKGRKGVHACMHDPSDPVYLSSPSPPGTLRHLTHVPPVSISASAGCLSVPLSNPCFCWLSVCGLMSGYPLPPHLVTARPTMHPLHLRFQSHPSPIAPAAGLLRNCHHAAFAWFPSQPRGLIFCCFPRHACFLLCTRHVFVGSQEDLMRIMKP